MLVLVLLLAAASLYVELRVVRALPRLARVVERDPLLSLTASLLSSLVLGAVFGAAGVITLAAGVLSTMVAQPYYALRRRMRSGRLALLRSGVRHGADVARAARSRDRAAAQELGDLVVPIATRVARLLVSVSLALVGLVARSLLSMVARFTGSQRR